MTSAAAQARRWYAMRISAMVLAVCVLVHLVTIIYAVRGGLSAAEILARTRGSVSLGAFYALFVLGCAVHASLGLAAIAEEWLGFGERAAQLGAWLIALALLIMGFRAVYAVVGA